MSACFEEDTGEKAADGCRQRYGTCCSSCLGHRARDEAQALVNHPTMKALFVSGYDDEAILSHRISFDIS